MARLYWGNDGKLWGGESLFWGAVEADLAALPAVWFHILVKADTPAQGVARVWTGHVELTLDAQDGDGEQDWIGGGGAMSITPARVQAGPSVDALTIQINGIPERHQRDWVIPVGGSPVEIRYISSEDHGRTWTLIPLVREGVLSGPSLSAGVYSVDVIDEYHNRSRAHPRTWSDEDQRTRYPGDQGMEGMRSLASGIDLRWPRL